MITDGDIAHQKITALRAERAVRVVKQGMLTGMTIQQARDHVRYLGLRIYVLSGVQAGQYITHPLPRLDRLNVMLDPITQKITEVYIG